MAIESMRRRAGLRAVSPGASSTWALALVVALAANASAGAEASWPESREGELARGWVEAFDAGEPAMRKFLAESLAASSVAAKGVEEQLVGYRSLREKLGALTLARVLEERPGALDVGLTDSHGSEHEFTFELEGSEAGETGEPRKLRSITGRLSLGHSMFPH